MMRTNYRFFSLIFCSVFFLFEYGCTPAQISELSPSVLVQSENTLVNILVPTLTSTNTPTITPKPTPTPTVTSTMMFTATPEPFLISFTPYSDGGDDLYICLHGIARPTFILYPDGKLVFLEDGQYLQSQLSTDEVQDLGDRLKDTGLFRRSEGNYLEGNSVLSVNGKTYLKSWDLPATDPLSQAIDIVIHYQPSISVRYVPESLFLGIWQYKDLETLDKFLAEWKPEISDWESSLLYNYGESWNVISGEDVAVVMSQFKDFPDFQVFKKGDDYFVAFICATYPYP
jgi:hypothetical protein